MSTIRKHGKLLGGLGIIVVLILVFFVLLFWNSSYSADKVKMSPELTDKIGTAVIQGSKLELNSDELNQIVSTYFKGGKYSNINVKGIKTEIKNSNLYFYVPVNYKGFNFLVTTYGTLNYKNDGIEYEINHISAGKIPVPKDLFYSKLKNKAKDKLTIKDNSIYIDKSKLPIKIKSLELGDSKITIEFEKLSNMISDKAKSMLQMLDKEGSGLASSQIQEAIKSSESGNTSSSNLSKSKDGSQKSPQSSGKNTGERDAALSRLSNNLNSALGSANSAGEKAVISEMISAANSMKGSPNVNPYAYSEGARAAYSKLSADEKMDLKSAVLSNVSSSDVSIISSMIGK